LDWVIVDELAGQIVKIALSWNALMRRTLRAHVGGSGQFMPSS
jgi:hypothetical protein